MPSDSTPPAPRQSRWRLVLLFFLSGLAVCFLALAYSPSLADTLESWVLVQPPPELSAPRSPDTVFDAPGIRQPAALPAEKAALDEDTPVVGVVAAGRARAYLLEAFEHGPTSHIVNDLLGDVPVSVTHCDLSGCTRVFTVTTPGRPLDIACGGIRGYRMVLKSDGHLYRQETGEPLDEGDPPFPYGPYPAELTTWGAWRQAHPGTDVYMGAVDEATPTDLRPAARTSPSTAGPPGTSR